MFELSVALKYLLPRRRQLSVSIIALVSMFVIALVVWLVLVFLSIMHGIEKRWTQGLVALNAPMRLTPTEAYYDSYYYLIDEHSFASSYTARTIREKLEADQSDPYDPEFDAALPPSLPPPDLDQNGSLRDPVKGAYAAIANLKGFSGVQGTDYEVALANLRLRLVRPVDQGPLLPAAHAQSFLTQASYLGSFDSDNKGITATLKPPTDADVTNLLDVLALSTDNVREESPHTDQWVATSVLRERLERLFQHARIVSLQSDARGWVLPTTVYPSEGLLKGVQVEDKILLFTDRAEQAAFLQSEESATAIELKFVDGQPSESAPIILVGGISLPAELDWTSLENIHDPSQLRFFVDFSVQGVSFSGAVPLAHLSIAEVHPNFAFDQEVNAPPLWVHTVDGHPQLVAADSQEGYGILLAATFRDKDVLLGDRGYLSYYASTPSSVQEQRIPVYVAGFYDPGIMPTGSRYVLTDRAVIADIRSSISQVEQTDSNGITVWMNELDRVDEAKQQISAQLEATGIAPYWQIETYREYEFAKPLVQQFDSDRNLLSLIAIIVIIVACSNIISMLILLVNDKKREIGILQSMGASPRSIAAIFAVCGTVMGLMGSLIGIGAALLTLANLHHLVSFLSALQGHEAFQAAFFGGDLPNEISLSVLGFVAIATVIISLLAGVIPAIKAARLKPAAILRSE